MDRCDVLLCMAPPWGRWAPPLGLAYLATYLRQVGELQADVFDFNVELYGALKDRLPELDIWNGGAGVSERHYWALLEREAPERLEEAIQRILDSGAQVVGFAINYQNTRVSHELIRRLKARRPELVCVVGGPQTFYLAKLGQLTDRESCPADYAVIGEGEIPLLALARDVLAGREVAVGPGVVRIGPGAGVPAAAPIHKDLSEIPFPTFEEFDLAAYHPHEGKQLHLPMLFTRGCPQRCTFCTDYKIAGGYRNRRVEDTVAELRHHVERYGVRFYHFLDLQFNSDHRLLRQLCEVIAEADLGITWASYGTVHRNNDEALFRKLKASGYHNIHYGFEHSSDRVLKIMNKRYGAELASRNIREAAAAGLGVAINIIVGYPGETEEDIDHLEAFLRAHADEITEIVNLSTAMLMVGSDLDLFPERFGLYKLDNGLQGTWTDESGANTYAERLARAERIKGVLDELGIPITNYNLEEDLTAFLGGMGLTLDAAQRESVAAYEQRALAGLRQLNVERRDLQQELAGRDEIVAHLRAENAALQARELEQGEEIARLGRELEASQEQLAWVTGWKGWICESPLTPRWLVRMWTGARGANGEPSAPKANGA